LTCWAGGAGRVEDRGHGALRSGCLDVCPLGLDLAEPLDEHLPLPLHRRGRGLRGQVVELPLGRGDPPIQVAHDGGRLAGG
jgi:hypothetical protein